MAKRIIPLLFLLKVALGDVHWIHNASELIEFSESVNNGESFAGTTVFLDSDIDFNDEFSQELEPIGKYYNKNHFQGVFDGQGHTLSNIEMNATSYVGLFGVSTGATIRNVVIDNSCTMSSFDPIDASMGGIVGYYYGSDNPLDVENCVNMATILFEGNLEDWNKLYIGGIIGSIFSYENLNDFTVKNCANYGPIICTGEGGNTNIGGIIGNTYWASSSKMYVQNCLNYGYIIYDGTTESDLSIGGIIGGSDHIGVEIENCVSAGLIISSNQTSENIGSIVGYSKDSGASISTVIKNCFWTSDVGYNASYGTGNPEVDDESSQVDLDMDFLDDLNNYSSTHSWNGWLLNADKVSVTFIINNGKGFTIGSEIILLPDPADNNENSFSGWFNDVYLSSPLNSSEITTETTLYGMFCGSDYSVTLDVNGGDSASIPASHPMGIECNSIYGTLPTPSRVGHTFSGWFNDAEGGVEITSGSSVNNQDNHILYAHWTPNNYTLTFIFSNESDFEVRVLEFNATIEYPKKDQKSNCTLYKWNSNITKMPAHDLNITAQWICHVVTIVFDKKTLGNTDVTSVIKDIVGEENVIIELFENDEDDTVIYIIKFIDMTESEVRNYVDIIKEDENLKAAIEKVDLNGEVIVSKDDDDDDNITIIIIVVVVVVVIVILIAILVNFLIWRKNVVEKRRRGTFSRVTEHETKTIDKSAFKSSFKKRNKIYPEDYVPPKNIKEALVKAGIDKDSAKEAADQCKAIIEGRGMEALIGGDFTLEDAAAICLYTFDFGGDRYDMNPYRVLNKALRAEKKTIKEIVKVRDVLFLVMTALRKLPVVNGFTLYRGIRHKVDAGKYKEGSTIVWPGFSSTSPDMNTTKAFLSKMRIDDGDDSESNEDIELIGSGGDNSGGTLFIIEGGWGYNVQPYSQYPEEEEILLEPEREFEVTSVTDSGDFLLITLEMKNTKVILPRVFGEGHM